MDRRSFLKSAGMTAAGSVFASEAAAKSILSNPGRSRSEIQSNDLSPWTPSASQPWDMHTINHLYRRAGFGATLSEIAAAKLKTPSEVVDALLDDSLLQKIPANPRYSSGWFDVVPYVGFDAQRALEQLSLYNNANMEIRRHWSVQMVQPATMLRERMTLFWMNHFVIESKKVHFPQLDYLYLSYMRSNAWGNFKKMVSDVTTLPAMLYYLDGTSGIKGSPNENYARELQELFTMGVYYKNDVTKPNYTQSDIEAIAVALTGWNIDFQKPAPGVLPPYYNVSLHDSTKQAIYDGVKRIYNLKAAENFGVASTDYDKDLIDHIFEQKGDAIAWYMCSKLYQNFVYHEISDASALEVIDAMAALFKQSNWEIKPVLSALLKSAHFFEEVNLGPEIKSNIGSQIKSPYDYLVNILRTFDIPIPENDPNGKGELTMGTLYVYALSQGQELLDPPNVKGWPGYHSWLSVTTLPNRNAFAALLIADPKFGGGVPIIGPKFDGNGTGATNALIPIKLSSDQLLQWAKQLTNYNGAFDDIVKEMATYFCAVIPSDNVLKDFVKSGFPNGYEWASLSDDNKVLTLRTVLTRIMQLANYQLS